MRKLLALACTIVAPCSGLFAEEEPEYDMEARRQSVVNLTRHIEQREARLAELREDAKRLDARIEKRVDDLVTMLSEIKDSKESRTRVAQIKMRAIAGLRGWIEIYQRRRSRILESLRQHGDHLPKEELAESIEAFDKRIEARVDQIMELTASMGDHQDVKKYESSGGGYWNGYHYESTRVSEKWKQNRRQTVMTDKTRRELIDGLEKAIRDLESKRAGIENQLEQRNPSESEREVLVEELGRVDGALDRRRKNLEDLVSPQGGASGQAVGRNKAHDIEHLLQDASEDLSTDFQRLLRMYNEFEDERNELFKLKENLQARKDWLEEHDQ